MQYELEAVPGIEGAGVLHVIGPNVMKGYLLHEQPGVIQPPTSIRAGWYSTGDIVTSTRTISCIFAAASSGSRKSPAK